MTNQQSYSSGELSDAEINWLTMRAQGGFGLVITGGWSVAPEGRIWPGQAALYDLRHTPALHKLGRAIAKTPALGVVQLIHGGSRATPTITQAEGISASAGEAWRAATSADIGHLVDAHVSAARRVQDAGLSGIEIHSAHGFLPAQFISQVGNTRADEWGGDVLGRSRFLRSLVTSIRSAVGPGFIIGVRLSPEDERHGIVLDETAHISALLAEDGIDYLHLSLGDTFSPSTHDPATHPLAAIRAAVPADLPIIAAGKIWTPEDAAKALELGADIVALGQAAIFNPNWPQRAQDSRWSPNRPPATPEQLEAVGVTAPFLAYYRDGWPEAVTDHTGSGQDTRRHDRND